MGFQYLFLIFNKKLIKILIEEVETPLMLSVFLSLKLNFIFIKIMLEHSLKDQIVEDSEKR